MVKQCCVATGARHDGTVDVAGCYVCWDAQDPMLDAKEDRVGLTEGHLKSSHRTPVPTRDHVATLPARASSCWGQC